MLLFRKSRAERVEHTVCKSRFLQNIAFLRGPAVRPMLEKRGEQGERNREGMGCTQRELQQPCSLWGKHHKFIFVFEVKKRPFYSTVRISGPPEVT